MSNHENNVDRQEAAEAQRGLGSQVWQVIVNSNFVTDHSGFDNAFARGTNEIANVLMHGHAASIYGGTSSPSPAQLEQSEDAASRTPTVTAHGEAPPEPEPFSYTNAQIDQLEQAEASQMSSQDMAIGHHLDPMKDRGGKEVIQEQHQKDRGISR